MKSEELKPCPFCGRSAHIEQRGTPRMSTIYQCDDCGCRLETGEERDYGAEWNRRAALSAAEADPVDYQLVFSDGRTSRVLYSKDEAERFKKASDITVDIRALYAAPPAPSVAVKALDDLVLPIAGTLFVARGAASARSYQEIVPHGDGYFYLVKIEDVAKALEPFRSALSAQVQDVAEERYRHKKRGSTYTVTARGRLQVDGDLDNEKVVVYRGEDGQTWVRPEYEFNDGRFEPLPAAPAKQEG